MVHDREFVVWYDQWQHAFDRAEDALDCFEYGLSDSCRLKITLRGDEPIIWHVEKREYGMWVPGHHPLKRRSLAFWRPTTRRLPPEPACSRGRRSEAVAGLTLVRQRPCGQRGVHFRNRCARLAFAAALLPLAESRLQEDAAPANSRLVAAMVAVSDGDNIGL